MGGISAAMQKRIALRMITSAKLTTCLVLAPETSSVTGGNLYSDAYQTQPVPRTWLLKGLNPTAPGLFGSESSGCIETHATIRTASGQLGAVFHSRGSSEESDQSSNFTEHDIWCAVLAPEIFPLIGADIEPYRRLLQ